MSEIRYMISETAKQVDVEAHVLRYWEEELSLPIDRNEMGHRYYTEDDITLFKNIKELKERGLPAESHQNASAGAEEKWQAGHGQAAETAGGAEPGGGGGGNAGFLPDADSLESSDRSENTGYPKGAGYSERADDREQHAGNH